MFNSKQLNSTQSCSTCQLWHLTHQLLIRGQLLIDKGKISQDTPGYCYLKLFDLQHHQHLIATLGSLPPVSEIYQQALLLGIANNKVQLKLRDYGLAYHVETQQQQQQITIGHLLSSAPYQHKPVGIDNRTSYYICTLFTGTLLIPQLAPLFVGLTTWCIATKVASVEYRYLVALFSASSVLYFQQQTITEIFIQVGYLFLPAVLILILVNYDLTTKVCAVVTDRENPRLTLKHCHLCGNNTGSLLTHSCTPVMTKALKLAAFKGDALQKIRLAKLCTEDDIPALSHLTAENQVTLAKELGVTLPLKLSGQTPSIHTLSTYVEAKYWFDLTFRDQFDYYYKRKFIDNLV